MLDLFEINFYHDFRQDISNFCGKYKSNSCVTQFEEIFISEENQNLFWKLSGTNSPQTRSNDMFF